MSNLLNFAAIIAIMRALGPAAYGQWAFAFSIIGVLLVTGHLGLDGLLVRKLVERPDNAKVLLGVTAALKYAVYLPAIAATLIFFNFAAGLSGSERTLLHVLMVAVLVAPLTSLLVAWSNARSQFGPIARGRIVAIVMGFTAKIALIGGGFGIVSVGMAHSTMFVLEAIILLYVVASRGGPMPWSWQFDRTIATGLLRQSLFLFAATIFAILYFNLDIMVLRAFRSDYEVGLYALVPQVILASQLLPYAVTLSRFPALTRAASDKMENSTFYREIGRLLFALLALSLAAMVALALFTIFAFDFVFGLTYASTKPLLLIACFALPPIFLRQLTTKVYIITDQGGSLAAIEFAGLAIILAMLLAAVPEYGGYAGIVAVSAGCWITVILSLLFLDNGRFVFRRRSQQDQTRSQ